MCAIHICFLPDSCPVEACRVHARQHLCIHNSGGAGRAGGWLRCTVVASPHIVHQVTFNTPAGLARGADKGGTRYGATLNNNFHTLVVVMNWVHLAYW